MKVALIGASGFVGSAILDELIRRGHQVTAVVRNPKNVKRSENVKVVQANAQNEEELTDVVKEHDVVVNAFNPGWTNPNIYTSFWKGIKRYKTA